jgi:hypothetical protein
MLLGLDIMVRWIELSEEEKMIQAEEIHIMGKRE